MLWRKVKSGIKAIFGSRPGIDPRSKKAIVISELKLLKGLLAKVENKSTYSHGIKKGTNNFSALAPHTAKNYHHLLTFDISSMSKVKASMLTGKVSKEVIQESFSPCGKLALNLPTSKTLYDIALIDVDKAIVKAMERKGISFVYTRYEYKSIISFEKLEDKGTIKDIAKQSVKRSGFSLKNLTYGHKPDTRYPIGALAITARIGAYDNFLYERIHIRKKTNKVHKLRYSANKAKLNCFYSLVGMPRKKGTKAITVDTLEHKTRGYGDGKKLAKMARIFYPESIPEKLIPETELPNNVRITTDPAMILGMSAFTTGWKSCMSILKQDYSYYKGVWWWLCHPGVAIAYQYDPAEEPMKINGVKRPKMISRSIIYHTDKGLFHGDIYSKNGHTLSPEYYNWQQGTPLEHALHNAGILQVPGNGIKVSGIVPQLSEAMPYFDNAYYDCHYNSKGEVDYSYITV